MQHVKSSDVPELIGSRHPGIEIVVWQAGCLVTGALDAFVDMKVLICSHNGLTDLTPVSK